jgi:hypothetical protein
VATPSRNLILEDIASTLAYITVAHGYATTVTTVERTVKGWDRIGIQAMPWLGLQIENETFEHHACSEEIRSVLSVAIVGHINAATQALRADAIAALQDDIIAAMNVDQTRGGNATTTLLTSAESDESDPDAIDSKGGQGTLIVRFDIVYYRTTTITYS